MTSLVARLIPASDRDAIVGDLLEEAACRDMRGARLAWWMGGQCAGIAFGLTVERARVACSLEMVREVASGIAFEGERMWHATAPRAIVTRVAIFAGGVILLALSGEVLVRALLTAANLH